MALHESNEVGWDDLRLFLALTRAETLAAAAESLGVHASTVFRRIGALEASLGAKLFERRAKGHLLTAHGERLLAHAERMESEVLSATRELAGADLRLRGLVRLATTDTIAIRLLAPALRAFGEKHPEIDVELLVDNRPVRLGRGEADLALRPGIPPQEGDTIAKCVAELDFAFFASKSFLKRVGRPKRRRDLARFPFVCVDSSLRALRHHRYLEERFAPNDVRIRSNSLVAQAAAVEAGMGIGLLPCFLFADRADVVQLFGAERELRSRLWLLTHMDLRRNLRVRALREHLQTWLAGQFER